MSEEDLHDFASTKDKGLPNRKKSKKEKVEKGVAKMRPCENCGRMMPITSQQCPKCGHVNALHWSQGGSFTRKALTSATPAQKEDVIKALVRVNLVVGAALAKARGRGA